jgi:hypothetical protein
MHKKTCPGVSLGAFFMYHFLTKSTRSELFDTDTTRSETLIVRHSQKEDVYLYLYYSLMKKRSTMIRLIQYIDHRT